MHDDQRDDDNALCKPSPEEIASACLEFQAGWSEAETIARRNYRLPKFRAVGVVELAEQAVAAKLEMQRERQRRAVTG
jgi:hypothetical protein